MLAAVTLGGAAKTRTATPRLSGAASGLALLALLASGCDAGASRSDGSPDAGSTPSTAASATDAPTSPRATPSAKDPGTGEEDADLQAATDVASRALQDFRDKHAAFPRRMKLDGDTLTLAGRGSGSLVSDDRIRPAVALDWYVDRADPREVRIGRDALGGGRARYTYCMSALGHHAVISGTPGTSGGAFGEGDCPTPPR